MVNQARLLETFKALSAFDAESYHEKEIADYLFRRLSDLGLAVEMDDAAGKLSDHEHAAGNIYGRMQGNSAGEAVLFSAHMDTVSPGKGKQVLLHPDGSVSSDGTTVLGADDLTGVAAILEALTVIREQNLPHPDIEVLFFAAEEPYCRGSSVFDFSKVRARMGYVLDLDGRVGRIANRAPTILQFRAEIIGKSAHAGFAPEEGVSAISAAALAISRLRLGRIAPNATANVGTIHGGTGRNVVPGCAVAEGEIRSSEDACAKAIADEIHRTFAWAAEQFGASLRFTVDEMVKAYYVPETSAVIRRYADAYGKLGYGKPEIVSTFGGSDNNLLNQHGIEGIVISNAMNKVHTVEEYFSMDEFVRSAEIVLMLAAGTEL